MHPPRLLISALTAGSLVAAVAFPTVPSAQTANADVRIIHATTGEVIRTLTIDPERRYHGTGRPPGGPRGPRKIKRSGP